jgi:hypothetical protein
MNTESLYTFDPTLPHCQWWLAITAPQISYNQPSLTYRSIGMRTDDRSPDEWIQEIGKSWNFNHRRGLHQVIHSLAMGQIDGQIWQEEFAQRACCTPHEWDNRIQMAPNGIAQGEMRYLDAVYRHVGTAGFRGWDFCRGSFMARAGYHAGWVTIVELTFLLNFFSTQIQRYFDSWQQYLQSFIFGRTYSRYLSDADSDEVNLPYLLGNGFDLGISTFFHQIENDQRCPIFSLPWQTPLPQLSAPESLQQLLSSDEEEY